MLITSGWEICFADWILGIKISKQIKSKKKKKKKRGLGCYIDTLDVERAVAPLTQMLKMPAKAFSSNPALWRHTYACGKMPNPIRYSWWHSYTCEVDFCISHDSERCYMDEEDEKIQIVKWIRRKIHMDDITKIIYIYLLVCLSHHTSIPPPQEEEKGRRRSLEL